MMRRWHAETVTLKMTRSRESFLAFDASVLKGTRLLLCLFICLPWVESQGTNESLVSVTLQTPPQHPIQDGLGNSYVFELWREGEPIETDPVIDKNFDTISKLPVIVSPDNYKYNVDNFQPISTGEKADDAEDSWKHEDPFEIYDDFEEGEDESDDADAEDDETELSQEESQDDESWEDEFTGAGSEPKGSNTSAEYESDLEEYDDDDYYDDDLDSYDPLYDEEINYDGVDEPALPRDLSNLNVDVANDISVGAQNNLESSSILSGLEPTKNHSGVVEVRQMPMYMFQGHYIAEPRLNRFIDGAIKNMASEMRLSSMDPIYFGVLPRGRVIHRNPASGKRRLGKKRKQRKRRRRRKGKNKRRRRRRPNAGRRRRSTTSDTDQLIQQPSSSNSTDSEENQGLSEVLNSNSTSSLTRDSEEKGPIVDAVGTSKGRKRGPLLTLLRRGVNAVRYQRNKIRSKRKKFTRRRNKNRKRKKKKGNRPARRNRKRIKRGGANFIMLRRQQQNRRRQQRQRRRRQRGNGGAGGKRRRLRRLRRTRSMGGGRVEGLSKVSRDGDAEMQLFGNYTLIRSHMKIGPVELQMSFRTRKGIRRAGSTLSQLRVHMVTRVNHEGSEMVDFLLDRPHPETIKVRGSLFPLAKTIAKNIFARLFFEDSFLVSKVREKTALALLSRPTVPN